MDIILNLEDMDNPNQETKKNDEGAPVFAGPDVFEGPEKTMEVAFRPGVGAPNGLRSMTRAQLDDLCEKASCSILTKTSNNYLDSYVLSESSLFVYKYRFIMKTCGTTTLLRCVGSLIEYTDALGMELCWVGYSRKNLLYPTEQLWPHKNFGDEIKYVSTHEKLQSRLESTGNILGPITGDHWFVYFAEAINQGISRSIPAQMSTPQLQAPGDASRTINLMMFDMPREVCDIFYQKNTASGRDMTFKAGINLLCPGAEIDETSFEPCGYSMNAILHETYSTIHITPQSECAYASFETNAVLDNYAALIRNALIVFRPKRFVLTMFGEQAAFDNMKRLPTEPKSINLPGLGSYERTAESKAQMSSECTASMACYSHSPRADGQAGEGNKAELGLSDRLAPDNKGAFTKGAAVVTPSTSLPLERRERGHSICLCK